MTKISGDLTLRSAAQLVQTLTQDLANHANITVVFDSVTGIDITTLQLLLAARTSALAAGKTLTLQVPADGMVPELLRRAGFVNAEGTPTTPEGDFWTNPKTKGKAA